MAEYAFTTTVNGAESAVLAGFCYRTATFYGKLFKAKSHDVPLKSTSHLKDESELYAQLEKWGIYVPLVLENAISVDMNDWNYGDVLISAFNRKFADLGFQINYMTSRTKRGLKK